MNENNEIFKEGFESSVSDNEEIIVPDGSLDAQPDDPENSLTDNTPDDSPEDAPPVEESTEPVPELPDTEIDTVSGSDVRTLLESSVSSNETSVSSGDIYNISIETPPDIPIWEKSINEYTVSEGLLLLIFILLLIEFCTRFFKHN